MSPGGQGVWRRYVDPVIAVDDEEWGEMAVRRGERVGLDSGELGFITRKEEELADLEERGRTWDEEKWERQATHIRRMELINRATAPVRLNEPSATKVFDVMATALTRNKAQLFPTRRRPKLRELDVNTNLSTVTNWFEQSEIRIGSDLSFEQTERVQRLLYT